MGDLALAAIDPSFGHGLHLLLCVINDDRSLKASDKLVISVAVTAIGDPARCQVTVEQAVGSGVSREHIEAVALSLALSRGLAPARVVLDALAASGTAAPAAPGADDVTSDSIDLAPHATADIVSEFAAVFGEVPERVRLLADHCPPALEAYHRMRVAVLTAGALPPMLAELVLFAVNATQHRTDYAEVHARGARRAGADEPHLVEAGLCTIPVGGVAAWLAASEAIAATREVS